MFPARALALYHFAPMTPMAAGAGIVLAMFAIFKAATQGLGFSQCTQQWTMALLRTLTGMSNGKSLVSLLARFKADTPTILGKRTGAT